MSLMVCRIFVAIIIALAIIAVILSSNPQVSEFFSNIFGKFSFEQEEEKRNIKFTLLLDSYEKISYISSRPVNISMSAKQFETTIGEAFVNVTEKDVSVTNYKGKIEINGSNVDLEGSFEGLLIPGIASFSGGNIGVLTEFNNLQLENFGPKKLSINTTGTLVIGSSESRFNGTINIDSAIGNFTFGDKLNMIGKAKKISIPSAGISIG